MTLKVKDIKKIDPLAEAYHLPGKDAGGFLLLLFSEYTYTDIGIPVPFADNNADILDGEILFVDLENGQPKIYHCYCPVCNAFLECKVPDAEKS